MLTHKTTPIRGMANYDELGFVLDRSRGSHQVWLHPVSRKRAIVPMHNKDIPTGTLYSILKQAGIEKDEL